MTRTGGLNILLAWVFFGILLAVLAWLLLRSGQDDALSAVARPGPDDAGSAGMPTRRPSAPGGPTPWPGGACVPGTGALGAVPGAVPGAARRDVRIDVRGTGEPVLDRRRRPRGPNTQTEDSPSGGPTHGPERLPADPGRADLARPRRPGQP
jgi:hypothetical protein